MSFSLVFPSFIKGDKSCLDAMTKILCFAFMMHLHLVLVLVLVLLFNLHTVTNSTRIPIRIGRTRRRSVGGGCRGYRSHETISLFHYGEETRDAGTYGAFPNGLQIFNRIIAALNIVGAEHNHYAHISVIVHRHGHSDSCLELHIRPADEASRLGAVGPNHLGTVRYGINEPRRQNVFLELRGGKDGVASRQRLKAVHIHRTTVEASTRGAIFAGTANPVAGFRRGPGGGKGCSLGLDPSTFGRRKDELGSTIVKRL